MKTVTVKVPATSANCGPGFDCLGLACTLYNVFTLEITDENKIKLSATGEGEGMLKPSERNFAVKAVRKVMDEAGCKKPGISITMHNDIPMSRGLGSSSAAIVGGMVAANELLGNPFGKSKILDLATEMEGHPDNVAPAIFGGVTVSYMEDGRAGYIRFLPPPGLQMIAVVPDFPLPTKLAREALPEQVSMQDAVFNVSRAALFTACMCQGNLDALPFALQDRLHQPYRSKLIPGLDAAFDAAKKAGALGSVISGSGSTLMSFAGANADAGAIGRSMCEEFIKIGKDARFHLLDFDLSGAKII